MISGILSMKYSPLVAWNFVVGAVYVLSIEQEEQTMPGIVVGVDGSLNSGRARDWARNAAAAQHARLTVMLAGHEVMKSYWTGKPVHDQHLGLTTAGRRS